MISNDQIKKDFQILELDQRANDYLRRIVQEYSLLVRGGSEYPQLFLRQISKRIDLAKGRIITCLPKETEPGEVYEFEHAKINRKENAKSLHQNGFVEIENTATWLVSIFKKYLEMDNANAIIFKTVNPLPTDPFLATVKEKMLVTDTEVFFFLTSEDVALEKIKSVMKLSDGAHPPLFAVCTVLEGSLGNGGKLSGTAIEAMVDNIDSIIVSAYDGDSYLVWHKQK